MGKKLSWSAKIIILVSLACFFQLSYQFNVAFAALACQRSLLKHFGGETKHLNSLELQKLEEWGQYSTMVSILASGPSCSGSMEPFSK